MPIFVLGIEEKHKCTQGGGHMVANATHIRALQSGKTTHHFREGKWLLTFTEAWSKWRVSRSISALIDTG
jgi:hypothetical protein